MLWGISGFPLLPRELCGLYRYCRAYPELPGIRAGVSVPLLNGDVIPLKVNCLVAMSRRTARRETRVVPMADVACAWACRPRGGFC
jgi:hypothetical protein